MTFLIRGISLFALLLALAVSAWGQESKGAGVVTSLQGQATVSRPIIPRPLPLKYKDDVFVRDRIDTRENSVVRVLLGGKALVTVRELSVLTITEEPNRAVVDLQVGKVAVGVAKKLLRPGESIEVRTPNAIASVRGSYLVAIVAIIGGVPQVRFTALEVSVPITVSTAAGTVSLPANSTLGVSGVGSTTTVTTVQPVTSTQRTEASQAGQAPKSEEHTGTSPAAITVTGDQVAVAAQLATVLAPPPPPPLPRPASTSDTCVQCSVITNQATQPPPPPVLSAITPNQVTDQDGLQTLTLTGSGFVSGSQVTLQTGSTVMQPTSTMVSGDGRQIQIQVDFPVGAPWTAQVTNANGASTAVGFAVLPNLAGVTPNQVTDQSGVQALTLTGSGFAPTAQVTLKTGTTEIKLTNPTVSSDGKQIRVQVDFPVGASWTAQVTNPGNLASAAVAFTVLPNLAGVTPNQTTAGTAQTLTLAGSGFASGAQVILKTGDQVQVITPTSVTPTQILIQVSGTLTVGDYTVEVTNPGDLASAPLAFMVLSPPSPPPPPLPTTDLSVSKVASITQISKSGNTVTYTIIVTNNGPDAATGVTLTDPLPAGVSLVSASSTQGSCGGTSAVTCSLGSLANGGTATVTIVVKTTTPGAVTNSATAGDQQVDPSLLNNAGTVVINVPTVPTLFPVAIDNNSKLTLANGVSLGTFSTNAPFQISVADNISGLTETLMGPLVTASVPAGTAEDPSVILIRGAGGAPVNVFELTNSELTSSSAPLFSVTGPNLLVDINTLLRVDPSTLTLGGSLFSLSSATLNSTGPLFSMVGDATGRSSITQTGTTDPLINVSSATLKVTGDGQSVLSLNKSDLTVTGPILQSSGSSTLIEVGPEGVRGPVVDLTNGSTAATGTAPAFKISGGTLKAATLIRGDAASESVPASTLQLNGTLLEVSGGTVEVGKVFDLKAALTTPSGKPLISVSGGTLNVTNLASLGANHTLSDSFLTQSGGSVTTSGDAVALAGHTLTTGSAAVFDLTDGSLTTLGSSHLVNLGGGTLTLGGSLLSLAAGSGTTPTVTIGGDVLHVASTLDSTGTTKAVFDLSGGTLSAGGHLASVNGGTVNLGGGLLNVTGTGLTSSTSLFTAVASTINAQGVGIPFARVESGTLNVTGAGNSLLSLDHSDVRVKGSFLDGTNSIISVSGPVVRLKNGSTATNTMGPVIKLSGGSLTADALGISDDTGNTFDLTGTLLDLSNGASVTLRTLGEEVPNNHTDTVNFNLATHEPLIKLSSSHLTLTGAGQKELVSFGVDTGTPITQNGVALIATGTFAAPSTISLKGRLLDLGGVSLTDSQAQIQLSHTTVTQTGPDPLIDATGLPVTMKGPALSAAQSAITAGGPLLHAGEGSLVSTAIGPFVSLSGSSLMSGDFLQVSEGGRFVTAGNLLQVSNGSMVTVNGAFIKALAEGLVLIAGAALESLGSGNSVSVSNAIASNATINGFPVLRTNGAFISLGPNTGLGGISLASSLISADGLGTLVTIDPVLLSDGPALTVSTSLSLDGNSLATFGIGTSESVSTAGGRLVATALVNQGFAQLAGPVIRVSGSSITEGNTTPLVTLSGTSLALGGSLLDATSGSSLTIPSGILSLGPNSILKTFGLVDPLIKLTETTVDAGRPGFDTHFLQLADSSSVLSLSAGLLSATGGSLTVNGDEFLEIRGGGRLEMTGTGSNPLVNLTNSSLATTGTGYEAEREQAFLHLVGAGSTVALGSHSLLTMTNPPPPADLSLITGLNLTGSLVEIGSGATLTAAAGALPPLVSLTGGSHKIGEAVFDLEGSGPVNNPSQPLQYGGVLFQTSGARVSVEHGLKIDPALLAATAPLFNFLNGSNVTSTSDLVKIVGNATVTANLLPSDALIKLNASTLTVNSGSLFYVGSGSTLSVTGNLVSLANGSTLNILNGSLVSVSGGSLFTLTGGSLGVFGVGTNALNITNSALLCAGCSLTTSIPNFGGYPVLLKNGALASNVTVAPGFTPFAGLGLTKTVNVSGASGAVLTVSGSTSNVILNP